MNIAHYENSYRGVCIPEDWKMVSKMAVQKNQIFTQALSLETVLDYKNQAVVKKLAEHFSCSITTSTTIFSDLKRFLWMITSEMCKESELIPTPVIDEAWHVFILFTKDYEDFCQRYFGSFIHHFPHTEDEDCDKNKILVAKNTIDVMYEVFGGIPSTNWHYQKALN